jgi:hypothetical protein
MITMNTIDAAAVACWHLLNMAAKEMIPIFEMTT